VTEAFNFEDSSLVNDFDGSLCHGAIEGKTYEEGDVGFLLQSCPVMTFSEFEAEMEDLMNSPEYQNSETVMMSIDQLLDLDSFATSILADEEDLEDDKEYIGALEEIEALLENELEEYEVEKSTIEVIIDKFPGSRRLNFEAQDPVISCLGDDTINEIVQMTNAPDVTYPFNFSVLVKEECRNVEYDGSKFTEGPEEFRRRKLRAGA
jgi:hypothetical protein